MRCLKCGGLRAMFATGYKPGVDGTAFVDSGTCVSCRHGKRPGAQVTWQGDVKAVLATLNSRQNRRGVKA